MTYRSSHEGGVERVLREADGPLSAEEVRLAFDDAGARIGIATVYRLLKRGVEGGRFTAVDMPNGPTRYEPADRPHHHHFECDACHRVYDVMGCPGRLDRLVPDGFTLESHDLLLHGRCASCTGSAAA